MQNNWGYSHAYEPADVSIYLQRLPSFSLFCTAFMFWIINYKIVHLCMWVYVG
jgi:hypothetical protein